jgi:hypothetical protein
VRRQVKTRLEERIEETDQAAKQAIDVWAAALDEVIANARKSWEHLSDRELVALARKQGAWLYGRLPRRSDGRAVVLEALEDATAIRLMKEQACGYDQVVKLQNRLAALVSRRKWQPPCSDLYDLSTENGRESGRAER